MKVLFLIHSLRKGGAERVALELALGFGSYGDDVHVLSWIDTDEYTEARYSNINKSSLIPSSQYSWPHAIHSSAKLIRNAINNWKPDLIHLHSPHLTWLLAYARVSAPCIHIYHGFGWIEKPHTIKQSLRTWISRRSTRRLSHYPVVVVESQRSVLAEHLDIAPESISYVPNGVTLPRRVKPNAKPNREPIILMVGTVCTNKGQHLAIDAFKKILHKIPKARLLIVGDGPEMENLKSLIHTERLEMSIETPGFQNDVHHYYQSATLLWHLSRSEAMPLAILEAMGAAVPVIGFDVRGVRDAVINGQTGHLVPYGDTTAIYLRTLELLACEKARNLMGKKSRERVEDSYTNDIMISQHHKLMQRLLSG